MIDLETHPRGVVLPVWAQAGARQHGITGTHDGMLRVSVTAAPEKGKANKAIIEVLADALGVSKSSVELAAGETSRSKRFLIVGRDVETVRSALREILNG